MNLHYTVYKYIYMSAPSDAIKKKSAMRPVTVG